MSKKSNKPKIDFPELLKQQLGDLGYAVTRELQFHSSEPLPKEARKIRGGVGLVRHELSTKKRRWAFDLAFEAIKLAVEVEGGIWIGGRHTRASGFVKDMEKYNAATLLGWRVLRVTTQQVTNGYAATLIRFGVSAAMKGWKQ